MLGNLRRSMISYLCEEGKLLRIGRGVYRSPLSEQHEAEAGNAHFIAVGKAMASVADEIDQHFIAVGRTMAAVGDDDHAVYKDPFAHLSD